MPKTAPLTRIFWSIVFFVSTGLLSMLSISFSKLMPLPATQTQAFEEICYPATVGLQIGHNHVDPLPAELSRLHGNTGAQDKITNHTELESNILIVNETAKILELKGITVEKLNAVIPANYTADAFISIHADGSENSAVNGYKVAASAYDNSGDAQQLADTISQSYQVSTNLPWHNVITSNMTHYYAFNSRRHEHSVNAFTPAVLLETGFITSLKDQELLIHNPQLPAEGLANGIINFLEATGKTTVC